MSHPLAHEGNPQEDELVITAGSVLSTASLQVIIPKGTAGSVPSTPTAQPPNFRRTCHCDTRYPNVIIGCPTCDFDFSWPLSQDNEVIKARSGIKTLHRPEDDYYGFCVVRLCCPPKPYGTFEGPWGVNLPDSHCSYPQIQLEYDGPLDGYPRTGLLLMVPGGTRDNLTGYALIVDHLDNKVKFCKFLGESLQGLGTVIASGAYEGAGSYYFEIDTATGSGDVYVSHGPSDTVLLNSTDTSITESDIGNIGGWWVGVCAIGGPHLGTPYIGASTAKWHGLSCECGLCYTNAKVHDATCDLGRTGP